MICVSAFYPAAGEGRFEMSYYLDKHIPMVDAALKPYGLRKIEIDEGLGGMIPGSAANYRIICRLYFDTMENLQAGLKAVSGQIFADVPNYTDIPIEIQVSRLVY